MRQLVYFLARDGRDGHIAFAPLIIVVQRLSSLVRSGTVTLDEDFLRSYIRHEHADFEELLLQLLKLKSLCVILDGIDEASDLRRNIADCVLTHLIASRMQLVVTSRPVGQSRPEYARFFLQIDLAPLTDEQQRQAINEQHADNETFKNLQSFSDLRRKHDDMYYRYSEEHRAEIEAVSGPTEKPRQRHNNPLQEANKISSTYLEKINAELTREEDGISVLTKLGFAVKEFQSPDEASNNDASGRRERVKELAKSLSALVHKKPTKIVVERLLEFIIKCREDEDKRSASELWLDVWQTSDQLYVVAESCQKGWDEWFDMIKKSEVECQIEPAPTLKDPIRVYEKVKNDYMGLMGGNDSPVSFVTDVIRARVFFTRLDDSFYDSALRFHPIFGVPRLHGLGDEVQAAIDGFVILLEEAFGEIGPRLVATTKFVLGRAGVAAFAGHRSFMRRAFRHFSFVDEPRTQLTAKPHRVI